jgi:hypothetical protein
MLDWERQALENETGPQYQLSAAEQNALLDGHLSIARCFYRFHSWSFQYCA